MTDDPYLPDELLGTGPSGKVYRGRAVRMNQTVRLKVLMDHYVTCPVDQDFIAQVIPQWQQLKHAGLAAPLALDVSGDEVTLVSEYAPGHNVWAFLHQHRPSPSEVRELALQLLQVLEAGEALHLPHGDLKPSNVIIETRADDSHSLQLQDWGLAGCRCLQPHETMVYRAPELLNDEPNPTAQSDLFSAGAILATLLLGHAPIHGRTEAECRAAWAAFDPSGLRQAHPDLDPAWQEWLGWLLRYDATQRPISAREALQSMPAASLEGQSLPSGKSKGLMFNLTLVTSMVGMLVWVDPEWGKPWTDELRQWLDQAWQAVRAILPPP